MTAPPRAEIHESIEICAPPEAVFRALTEPARLAAWWGAADMYRTRDWVMELVPGGRWSCEIDEPSLGPQRAYGEILELEAPRRLVWTWNTTWDHSGGSIIRYDLSATARGTRLEVRHSGFIDPTQSEGYRTGWPLVLRWLAAHLSAPA